MVFRNIPVWICLFTVWVESCRAVRGFRVEGLGLLDLRIRIYKSTVYREW